MDEPFLACGVLFAWSLESVEDDAYLEGPSTQMMGLQVPNAKIGFVGIWNPAFGALGPPYLEITDGLQHGLPLSEAQFDSGALFDVAKPCFDEG